MEKEEYFANQSKSKDTNSEIISKFSAEIIQLRDAMLKQLEPFDTPEKIKKLKKLVDASSDTLRKLAGLAARIQIIRSRLTELASLSSFKIKASATSLCTKNFLALPFLFNSTLTYPSPLFVFKEDFVYCSFKGLPVTLLQTTPSDDTE